jgi:hypothetical protein
VKLSDCPVLPAEAGTALSTDRGLGWRLARQAGPVLRHPEADGMFGNWVFVVGREEVLAHLDDARLDCTRALPESDLEVHQQLFAPKSAHDVAAEFRPSAAALIDRFVAVGGGDAVADVTTPMADALFDTVSRLQLLPVEHLHGRPAMSCPRRVATCSNTLAGTYSSWLAAPNCATCFDVSLS